MPRGNGTGPEGMGPMTGRGMGNCTGYSAPGIANAAGRGAGMGMAYGRGGGGGLGLGRGRGRCRFQTPYVGTVPNAAGGYAGAIQDEETVLKSSLAALETQLAIVNERLSELSKAKTTDL